MGENDIRDERLERMEQSLLKLEKMVEAQQSEIAMLRNQIFPPARQINPEDYGLERPRQAVTPPVQQVQQQVQPPVQQVQPPIQQQVRYPNVPLKPKESFENRLGKSMGIIASMLVFISMILFVTLVYSSLTDMTKVICLFVFSFGILLLGAYWMRKKKNFFTLSITGCGMGAIFLSLFITNVYFHMLNQWALLILIAVWAICVKMFFAKVDYCFEVIGQVGVTVAILFGCSSFVAIGSMEYLFLVVIFIAVSLVYLLVGSASGVAKAFPMAALNVLSILFLCIKLGEFQGDEEFAALFYILTIVLAIMELFVIYWYIFRAEKNIKGAENSIPYVILIVYSWWHLSVFLGNAFCEVSDFGMFMIQAMVIVSLLVAELLRVRQKNESDIIHTITIYVLYFALVVATNTFETFSNLIGIGLYIFPLLAIGYWWKDKTAISLSYITMAMFAIMGCEYLTIELIVNVLAITSSAVALIRDKNVYNKWFKCAWYLIFMLTFFTTFRNVTEQLKVPSAIQDVWIYMILAMINAIICHVGFARDWKNPEQEEKVTRYLNIIINAIFMIVGFGYITNSYYKDFMKMLILVVSAFVYTTNIKYSYEKFKKQPWSGIYNGAKLSIFLYITLRSYELTGPYVSLGWLVLAIVLITVGFITDYRYLRLYGLFLTMFSIVKLLVFDIHYDNGVVRALSFLISGLLCFAINMLYNFYNKKIQNQ